MGESFRAIPHPKPIAPAPSSFPPSRQISWPFLPCFFFVRVRTMSTAGSGNFPTSAPALGRVTCAFPAQRATPRLYRLPILPVPAWASTLELTRRPRVAALTRRLPRGPCPEIGPSLALRTALLQRRVRWQSWVRGSAGRNQALACLAYLPSSILTRGRLCLPRSCMRLARQVGVIHGICATAAAVGSSLEG